MMNEKEYLDQTKKLIRKQLEKYEVRIEQIRASVSSIQDYYWENYAEFDEYGYEMFDNTNAIVQASGERADYIKQQHILTKMLDSPYFAKVDFCYEGEAEPQSFYIGLFHLADQVGKMPFVYDWRAPVSSLFYDYETGPAGYDAPMGRLDGDITDKLQIKIKHGELIYAIHSDLNIDDDILKEELAAHADAGLKSIVTTIQREQNRIIRDKDHRILVVQGCAGSGKTSVAMHRVAYLLYHNRSTLKASQVLILSPNDVFSDYISRILPELGEENISRMEFDVFAWKRLQHIAEAQDLYDALEYRLRREKGLPVWDLPGYELYTDELSYKQSKEFVEELDGYLLEAEYDLVDLRQVSWNGVQYSLSQISEFFYEKFWNVPILSRMSKIADIIIDAAETKRNKDFDEEIKLELMERLNRMYRSVDLLSIYNDFLEKTGRRTLPEGLLSIPYEDVYPLLYLKYGLWEKEKMRTVKHLIIDEMQDYSYLQYRILGRLFDCPMTILGDEEQFLFEDGKTVLANLKEILGKEMFFTSLDKSYRSTAQITSFANALKGNQKTNCIGREGNDPQEIPIQSNEEMIVSLMEKCSYWLMSYETIGVICSDQEEAESLYKQFAAYECSLPINLLTKDSHRFEAGICITPYYLSKGLEFDCVLIPNRSSYEYELASQGLYIATTRALHELLIFRTEN